MNTPKYPVINFMKYKVLYFVISLIFIIPGVISIFSNGLNPAIDFTGGSLLELQITPQISDQELNNILTQFIDQFQVIRTDNGYLIRTQPIDNQQNQQIQSSIASYAATLATSAESSTPAARVTEIQFATIGPTLGRELLQKTFYSVLLAAIAILGYIAYRFKDIKFGATAIIAMLHDTLILLGVFSILGVTQNVQVDTLFVTAILTTLSFSVHDTIVVFDRIRESKAHYPNAPMTDLINKSVNETLARSINNSMTIIFMLLALWLLGGETIRWFVFALLIGTIAGTYSSTFTAAPLLDLWFSIVDNRKSKQTRPSL